MRYKVKWRAEGEEPLQPELFETVEQAKSRARQLKSKYGERVTIDVWNEDETWQIVASPGIAAWCAHLSLHLCASNPSSSSACNPAR
jgi:hypothetical protein